MKLFDVIRKRVRFPTWIYAVIIALPTSKETLGYRKKKFKYMSVSN
jgi:hypothetical protein